MIVIEVTRIRSVSSCLSKKADISVEEKNSIIYKAILIAIFEINTVLKSSSVAPFFLTSALPNPPFMIVWLIDVKIVIIPNKPYSSGEINLARTIETTNMTKWLAKLSTALHPTPFTVFFFNPSFVILYNS